MLCTTLRDESLPGYIEHSGGGYHVWTFTETPAGIAHRAGKALVQRTLEGYEYLPSPVEVYPKQPAIGSDGWGNLVKLPLGLHYSGKRTIFLDPTTFEPMPDQWGYLLGFERAAVTTLATLAQEYQTHQKTLPMAPGGFTGDVQVGPPCVANMLRASLGDGEGRNNILFQLAVDLRRGGLVDEESLLLVLEPWNERQQTPLSPREFGNTVRQACRTTRAGFGCEKDYITPYCEADTCPIFLGQQQRAQKSGPPPPPPPAPRTQPEPPIDSKSLNRYLRDKVYNPGFRYDHRMN
jgi:hypothetical protein